MKVMIFNNYEEYKKHVCEMWEEGYINELEMDELIIAENPLKFGESKNINYRLMTEEEYNIKFNETK